MLSHCLKKLPTLTDNDHQLDFVMLVSQYSTLA